MASPNHSDDGDSYCSINISFDENSVSSSSETTAMEDTLTRPFSLSLSGQDYSQNTSVETSNESRTISLSDGVSNNTEISFDSGDSSTTLGSSSGTFSSDRRTCSCSSFGETRPEASSSFYFANADFISASEGRSVTEINEPSEGSSSSHSISLITRSYSLPLSCSRTPRAISDGNSDQPSSTPSFSYSNTSSCLSSSSDIRPLNDSDQDSVSDGPSSRDLTNRQESTLFRFVLAENRRRSIATTNEYSFKPNVEMTVKDESGIRHRFPVRHNNLCCSNLTDSINNELPLVRKYTYEIPSSPPILTNYASHPPLTYEVIDDVESQGEPELIDNENENDAFSRILSGFSRVICCILPFGKMNTVVQVKMILLICTVILVSCVAGALIGKQFPSESISCCSNCNGNATSYVTPSPTPPGLWTTKRAYTSTVSTESSSVITRSPYSSTNTGTPTPLIENGSSTSPTKAAESSSAITDSSYSSMNTKTPTTAIENGSPTTPTVAAELSSAITDSSYSSMNTETPTTATDNGSTNAPTVSSSTPETGDVSTDSGTSPTMTSETERTTETTAESKTTSSITDSSKNVTTSPMTTTSNGPCPDGWRLSSLNNGKCYLIVSNKENWVDAEAYCKSQLKNSHLTSVCSAEENYFLAAITTDSPDSSNCGLYWIGLNNFSNGTANMDKFIWVDGSQCGYNNWAQAHTNPIADKVCGFMTESGEWYLDACEASGVERCFICEHFY